MNRRGQLFLLASILIIASLLFWLGSRGTERGPFRDLSGETGTPGGRVEASDGNPTVGNAIKVPDRPRSTSAENALVDHSPEGLAVKIVDVVDRPVAGAEVFVLESRQGGGRAGSRIVTSANLRTTDAQGTARFSWRASRVDVKVSASGYVALEANDQTVPENGTLIFRLSKGRSIGGLVSGLESGDHTDIAVIIRPATESAWAGDVVRLREDGSFEYDRAPGEDLLMIIRDDHGKYFPERLHVPNGVNRVSAFMKRNPGKSLGKLVLELPQEVKTKDSVLCYVFPESGGPPAELRYLRSGEREEVKLAEGMYLIYAHTRFSEEPGLFFESTAHVTADRVVAVPLNLKRAGILEGTILDNSSSNPIERGNITLMADFGRLHFPLSKVFTSGTNSYGEFRLGGIKPGSHLFRLSAEGYEDRYFQVDLYDHKIVQVKEFLVRIKR